MRTPCKVVIMQGFQDAYEGLSPACGGNGKAGKSAE